jgi:hypothetical protein
MIRKSIGTFVDQQYKQSKIEEERAQLFERRTRGVRNSHCYFIFDNVVRFSFGFLMMYLTEWKLDEYGEFV